MKWIKRPNTLICMLLAVITLAAYWQVRDFDLTTRDDNDYVTNNQAIHSGLNMQSMRWAFTDKSQAAWQPLTWLSLMLDYQRGELDPSVYHLTNVYLHVLVSLLLFIVMNKATGLRWPSALVAALFAIHPMHVESVAWVAERKDVLSGVFWMLTMWAYLGYAKKPSPIRSIGVAALFALGLMTKPMLVTLPFMLLMMDVTILRRLDMSAPCSERFSILKELLLEKWALFVLSAASCVVTFWTQNSEHALASMQAVTIWMRLSNVAVSYVEYVLMMFWPANMCCLYPFPESIPVVKTIGAILLLIGVTYASVRYRRRRPWLFFGWLWYVITLIPVIGIVQVSNHAMADRFTYIPYVGLFCALAYNLLPPKAPGRGRCVLLAGVCGLALAALWIGTYKQIGTWHNSETLYAHAIAVTKRNSIAHNGLGSVLAEKGDFAEAEHHFRIAVKQQPAYIEARNNLAGALGHQGMFKEAEAEYRRVIRDAPEYAPARVNLGALFAIQGNFSKAVKEWKEALKINPNDPDALGYLAQVGVPPNGNE